MMNIDTANIELMMMVLAKRAQIDAEVGPCE